MTLVITVALLKGGASKTTSAVALAEAAALSVPTVLIDTDPMDYLPRPSDRQCVGGVGFGCFSEPQDHPHHESDLCLLRPALANNCLLNPPWWVFVNCQSVLGSREQGRSSRCSKRYRGACVLDIDQPFNGTDFRTMKPDQLVNLTMDLHQATRHRQSCLVPDDSITDRARAGSLSVKNRIPRVPKRWVKG